MTLRFLGLEDKLDMDAELPKDYKGTEPDDWMIPYIDEALVEGILLSEEMDDFKPNSAASRAKTAVYMVRALDMVEEAEDYMDEDLPFKDESAVKDEYVGYVYLVHDLGLMIGYNDTFQPNKSVTRAELSVLFARMVSMSDTDYAYTMTGGIHNLVFSGDEMIAIKSGSTYAQYDLDELVYDDEDLVGATITPEGEDEEEYFFSEDIQICINEEDVDLEDLENLDFEGDIEYEVFVSLLGNGEIIILHIEFDEP